MEKGEVNRMSAWLAKLLIAFAPEPKKIVEFIIIGLMIPFILFFMLILTPTLLLKTVPMAKPSQIQFYVDAAETVNKEKGVQVDWKNVIAIDAVLLEQDFSRSSSVRAVETTERFIKEEKIEIEYEEVDPRTGKKVIKTRIEKKYVLKSKNEVTEELISEGVITRDQVQDIELYLSMNLDELRDVGSDMPPGWTAAEGNYKWPIPGCYVITSKFGPRVDPIEGVDGFHTGVDIGGHFRTTIYAAKEGIVKRASYSGNAGNAVILKHPDGTETRYYHMDEILVKKGQNVTVGQPIGLEGTTGKSTGPHLHFEIRVNGEPVDPLMYFN